MLLNVRRNHLVRNGARRGTARPTRPQLATPIPLVQCRVLFLQLARRLAFAGLQHIQHRLTGRRRDKERHMRPTNMPFQYQHLMLHTANPNYVPCPLGYLTRQDMVALLRHPHQMILASIQRMRSLTITSFGHCATSGVSLAQKNR